MQILQTLALLVVAATLEVGGDSLIRHGLRGAGLVSMVLGALTLIAYGFLVNLTSLDFSRLMGLYIVIFFVVAQGVAIVWFREKLLLPVMVGGMFIIAGGLVMMLWRPR